MTLVSARACVCVWPGRIGRAAAVERVLVCIAVFICIQTHATAKRSPYGHIMHAMAPVSARAPAPAQAAALSRAQACPQGCGNALQWPRVRLFVRGTLIFFL